MEFTLELLSVEQPEEYEKESWQMGADEKLSQVPELKAQVSFKSVFDVGMAIALMAFQGNELFREGKLSAAEEKYRLALGLLEQLMLREKPEDDEWLELRRVKTPILLNFAQCKLSKGEFYEVIEHCDEALKDDPGKSSKFHRK